MTNDERIEADSRRTQRLTDKMAQRAYRDSYVGAHTRTWLAAQIRGMRIARGISQSDFGRLIGKPQSTVARLENPNYGRMTVNTLLKIARVLDVGLVVRFVDIPTFVAATGDMSEQAMDVPPCNAHLSK